MTDDKKIVQVPAAIILPSRRPPAPLGIMRKQWANYQDAIRSVGVPEDRIEKIDTLRKMNLWVWFLFVHPFAKKADGIDWKWIADNEESLLKTGKEVQKEMDKS